MHRILYRISSPQNLPATLAQIKEQLRLGDCEDDSQEEKRLLSYLRSATKQIDGKNGWLGRCLITQDWGLKMPWFPSCEMIRIPLPPLQQVLSVSVLDSDGNYQDIDPSHYRAITEGDPGILLPADGKSWPTTLDKPDSVRIVFRAGYGDDWKSVPDDIRDWLLMRVGDYYNNRETLSLGQELKEIPHITRMIENYRIWV